MSRKDFTYERATVTPVADSSTDQVLRFQLGDQVTTFRVQMPTERAQALSDRWNACADARNMLDRPENFTSIESQLEAVLKVLDRAVTGS